MSAMSARESPRGVPPPTSSPVPACRSQVPRTLSGGFAPLLDEVAVGGLGVEKSGRPVESACRKGATFHHDDLEDDQAIVVYVKGKGLVIVAGCAQSGIVNTVNHAREKARYWGAEKVYTDLAQLLAVAFRRHALWRRPPGLRPWLPSLLHRPPPDG